MEKSFNKLHLVAKTFLHKKVYEVSYQFLERNKFYIQFDPEEPRSYNWASTATHNWRPA